MIKRYVTKFKDFISKKKDENKLSEKDDKIDTEAELSEKDSTIKFEKLTPKSDSDIRVYREAMNYALSEDDVKNVALSGIYSSGKSSVIETYKKESDKNFLHVSLGYYNGIKQLNKNSTNLNEETPSALQGDETQLESPAKENAEIMTNDIVLEGKILNQLLHQIDPSKIPQTIFKIKKNVSKWSIFFVSAVITLGIILLLYLLNFKNWVVFIAASENIKGILDFSTSPLAQSLAFILLAVLICALIFKFFEAQINKNVIKKLTINGNDIEVFNESQESYFDKYLNDVIYLFENCGSDVIVFEDIDRFDNNNIFQKLKEINTLVNNRKKINGEKIIFLYLLKDDMFLSKDRTKFFDFIIPIIPVIDSSNSYEKLIEVFQGSSMLPSFDDNFLQKISLYIDDMRLLKNIYNEFMIYHRKINTINLDSNKQFSINLNSNKLFSLITYKNIFPNDFSMLQLNQGFIYNVIYNRDKYLMSHKMKLNQEIKDIDDFILKVQSENLESISEVEAIILNENDLSVNGKSADKFESRIELIKEIKKTNSMVRYISQGMWKDSSGEALIELIHQNPIFIDKNETLEFRSKSKQAELMTQKKILKEKMNALQFAKIKDIISKDDIKNMESINTLEETNTFEYIKRSEYYALIVFLIRNGHIDEDYADYMTFFYPNSISVFDKLFLKSITDEIALDWDHRIDNPEKVVHRMNKADFLRSESLNFYVTTFLLANHNGYREKLRMSLNNLKDTENLTYIMDVYKQLDNKLRNSLITLSFDIWDELTLQVIDSPLFSDGEKSSFLISAFQVLSTDQLNKINTENKITLFLEGVSSFFEQVPDEKSNLLGNISGMKIKFPVVRFNKVSRNIADYIFNNNLYKVNFNNIESIMQVFFNVNIQTKKSKIYTMVHETNNEVFKQYINENINDFIDEYEDFSESKVRDDVVFIYEVLNNTYLTGTAMKSYMNCLSRNILDLSMIIELDVKEAVIINNLAIVSEKNIIHYFIEKDMEWTEELISFVNSSSEIIAFDKKDITDSIQSEFFRKTIQCENLQNDKYEFILGRLARYSYSEGFPFGDITNEKMHILIKMNIIRLSLKNLKSLRDRYSKDIVNDYIVTNLKAYLKMIDDSIYNYDELLNILDTKTLPTSDYKKVIDKITEPISIKETTYSNEIINYIIINKFDESDLDYLIFHYPGYINKLRKSIHNIAVDSIERVLSEEIPLPSELLFKIVNEEKLELDTKKMLFSRNIGKAKTKELLEMLNMLGLGEYIQLLNGKNPKFDLDDMNENILTDLKKRGLISGFKTDGDNFRGYSKRKRK